MKHTKFKKQISRYVDGELNSLDAAIVEGHIDNCAHCAGYLSQIRKVAEYSETLKDIPPPSGIDHLILYRIRNDRKTFVADRSRDSIEFHSRKFFPVATAICAILLCVFFVLEAVAPSRTITSSPAGDYYSYIAGASGDNGIIKSTDDIPDGFYSYLSECYSCRVQ